MIQKGIPLPAGRKKKVEGMNYGCKYPWRQCTEVWDSFVTEEKDIDRVMRTAQKFCQRNRELKYKFEAHRMEDGTIRVWRTA